MTAPARQRCATSTLSVVLWLLWCVVLPVLFVGCAGTNRQKTVSLPARHVIKSDQLVVLSDFKIPAKHPFVQDLKELRREVSSTLDLPLGTKPVVVYIFDTELAYQQYWDANFPGLPPRRAYFIKTPNKELAVYTHWGERIQEDLRHEFTHGLLHAALQNVPLWLDEGIAEYFEVPVPGQVNRREAERLAQAIHNGWRPDMNRLEKLERVDQMKRTDYRESWAWVHFMLHSSPDSRQVLLGYLQELRHAEEIGALSARLEKEVPAFAPLMLAHMGTLPTTGRILTTSATEERESPKHPKSIRGQR